MVVHNRRALDIELTRPCTVQMDQVKSHPGIAEALIARGELHRLPRPSLRITVQRAIRAEKSLHGVIKIYAEILYLVAQGDLQGSAAPSRR